MSTQTAMIALGGNSLSKKGQTGTIEQQFEQTRQALEGIRHFIDQDYKICINHGNGPQVGAELLKNEIDNNNLIGDNFPMTSVSDIEIDRETNDMIVSSHGRGIYKINLNLFFKYIVLLVLLFGIIVLVNTVIDNSPSLPTL